MKNEFICGNKYTISPTQTIALSVPLDNLPSELITNGNRLILKSSFHISLVCIQDIIIKHNVSISNFRDEVIKDFCDFVKTNDVNLLNYINDFRFAEENDLKTIVVMCEVSNLDKFFEILNKKYKLHIEYPPTHVTLYKLEDKVGIFLTDADDLKNLTKSIPNPIGRLL